MKSILARKAKTKTFIYRRYKMTTEYTALLKYNTNLISDTVIYRRWGNEVIKYE